MVVWSLANIVVVTVYLYLCYTCCILRTAIRNKLHYIIDNITIIGYFSSLACMKVI